MVSSRNGIPSTAWIVAALLSSCALFFHGTGLHPVWWVMWLAPIPIFLIIPRISAALTFSTATLAFGFGGLNMWHYMRDFLGIPVGIILIAVLIPSCLFGLVALSYRSLIRREALWQAVLVVPALWVTLEYLNSITSPHSTFGNLGYTQMDCLPLIQFAAITGIWGISFCVFLLAATVAGLFSRRGTKSQRRTVAFTVAGFLISVFAYGSWRLHSTPATEHSATVLLIASDSANNVHKPTRTL